jgi:hypothetical protein
MYMKTVSLIILMLSLLQPLAGFAHPCASCLGIQCSVDTSGNFGSHPHNQDAEVCDSTICGEENVYLNSLITVIYAPLVSVIVVPERCQELPKVVIPIFVPPQSLT